MQLIKALLYLEVTSVVNKLRNWRKYKLQLFFLLLFWGLNIYFLTSGYQKITANIATGVEEYIVDISYLLILLALLFGLQTGSKQLPLSIPKSASSLLFSTSLRRKWLFGYLLVKELLINLIISFFGILFLLFMISGGLFPAGWLLAWLGLFWLFLLEKLFALISFNLREYYGIDLSWASFVILVSLVGHLLGSGLNGGLSGIVAGWRSVYIYLTGGLEWLVQLLIYPLSSVSLTAGEVIIPFILTAAGLVGSIFCLPDCKEAVAKTLSYRQKINQGLESGKFEDPQQMMLLFSAPVRKSKLANWTPNFGSATALLWKRIVEWERLWQGELRTAVTFILIISIPLGLAASFWNLPYWLILIMAVLLNQQGRNVIVESKKSLIYNLSASWNKKLTALICPTLIENILYHLAGATIFFGIIFLHSGLLKTRIVLLIILLIIPLNTLFIVLGLLGYLLSVNLIGTWKTFVKLFPLVFHFILVIGGLNLLGWQFNQVIFFSLILLFLTWAWLQVVVRLFERINYEQL